ncbi:Hint domain-containing protein [Rhodophyticola sp. CCM32]|uniref:Hint domain-containing protein n=1 Tax=Rhodophyticola sp. CCM32 TaxID=2916397 RepID=UPI00107EECD7|nr:Hint domain-containing protein [Rhodophyticola sp. CCM32]QBY02162.1 Hint domain-containing protein [Rhodophyticola sp. CCM32]
MARISELHYSNAFASQTGISEFLEVALSPGEDPADFSVGFYQSNGNQGVAISLADPGVQVTFDPDTNETLYVISADNFNIRLTDPDGGGSNNYEAYALVDTSSGGAGVVDFYDIGGGTSNITALDGVAQGAVSENIPVPTSANSATYSIQFNQPDPGTVSYEEIGAGDSGIICFAAGTLIETTQGPRPVERLRPGDLVLTEDAGPQPLLWVGASRVPGTGKFAPVRFDAGAIGNTRPLTLSPQHRVLISGWQVELVTGATETLVAACHLINGSSIRRIPCAMITYHHIMFDQHHIIRSEGALTESFYPGPEAVAAVDEAARGELQALFPDLASDFGPFARDTAFQPVGAVLAAGL